MSLSNFLIRGFSLVLLVVASGCGSADKPVAAKPATPVRVARATQGPAAPPISTTGIVANKDEMRLSFKVGGVIRKISVQEGVAVKKGQQLAEIELTEVNAQVEQARQLANKADRDLARGENLYADQVISLEQLQNLRTQAALAKAQLRAADFNRGYAAITAPGDAVVLRRLAEERELVPAGQPILILGGSGRGFVMRCALADREVVQLKLGDRGTAQLDAFPGKSFVATVSEIARVSDPVTGLFDVELRFDAAPVGLVSGLIARIELSPAAGVTHTLTYIPIGALVQADGNRASVFVVADDTARKRDVEVAFIAADSVALAAGVAPGDAVVSDGALYLDDGEHIRILATGEPDSR